MAETEQQFVAKEGGENGGTVTDAQVLQTLEIPKTLMQEDNAGDASAVTQFVVVSQNGQAGEAAGDGGETVVLMQVEGENQGETITMEEEVVEETVPMEDGHQEEDEDETGLLQPGEVLRGCLLYTSPSPRDISGSRMPSSA